MDWELSFTASGEVIIELQKKKADYKHSTRKLPADDNDTCKSKNYFPQIEIKILKGDDRKGGGGEEEK